nr:hypothetical protein [uncultured bacterium]
MRRYLYVIILLSVSSFCLAQTEAPAPAHKPSLSQLAAESDLVAVAQLVQTEYELTRGFPSKGHAVLRLLITYKSPREYDLIQVNEEGLKEHECYFPDTSVWQEGQRFLVFLNQDEEQVFEGHPQVCALSLLVTEQNLYALRMPQESIELGAEGSALVQDLVYVDPAARVDATELTRTAIAEMGERLYTRQIGDELIYTRGIILTDVRRLIGPEALSD